MSKNDKKQIKGVVYYPTKEAKARIEKILKRDFDSSSRGFWFLANAYSNKEFLKNLISLSELKIREFEKEMELNNLKSGGKK
jgi:hypothetical protein